MSSPIITRLKAGYRVKVLPIINQVLHRSTHSVSSSARYCFSVSKQAISFLHAEYIENKFHIKFCDTYPYEQSVTAPLAAIAKSYNLQGVTCDWVLQPEDYQLILTEALPVPVEELDAALRWKLKDLIQYPLEDLVLDTFPLPQSKIGQATARIMVVAAKASYLKEVTQQVYAAGLKLNKITITDLALHNISATLELDDAATMLIYLQEKAIYLLVTCQKQYYFTRSIEIQLNLTEENQELEQEVDKLALEMQRTFDYYQSQWHQPLPTRILIAPTVHISDRVYDLLSQRLSLVVHVIDISPSIVSDEPLTVEQEDKYLSLIGEVLRQEA